MWLHRGRATLTSRGRKEATISLKPRSSTCTCTVGGLENPRPPEQQSGSGKKEPPAPGIHPLLWLAETADGFGEAPIRLIMSENKKQATRRLSARLFTSLTE